MWTTNPCIPITESEFWFLAPAPFFSLLTVQKQGSSRQLVLATHVGVVNYTPGSQLWPCPHQGSSGHLKESTSSWELSFFLFKDLLFFIWKSELHRQRTKRERDFSINWFSPLMATKAGAGPLRSHKPGAGSLLWHYYMSSEAQALGAFSVTFPGH